MGARREWFRDRDGFRNPSPFRIAAATNLVNGVPVSYAGNISSVTKEIVRFRFHGNFASWIRWK